MTFSLFTIDRFDFERLGAQDAVVFFRNLLWAEARRLRIPSHKVHVSDWINVPDGGVDASVESYESLNESGIFIAAHTGYQIKASKIYQRQQDFQRNIRQELFGKNKRAKKDNLGASVRQLLDDGGAYVLVCFKQDFVETQRVKSENFLRELFSQCGYVNPQVAVWGQNEIVGMLQPFPSLSLYLAGRGHLFFETHKTWANHDDMRVVLELGVAQNEFITNLQSELRRDNEAVLVHVWGEAGIGKTKLVLEATSAEDLEPLVLYCQAARFVESALINELLRPDNAFNVVLILDECNRNHRAGIWNQFKHAGSRIKIVTIYNEFDRATGSIRYFDVPPLGSGEISRIIQGYQIPKEKAQRFTEFCGGSPRVAHVVGTNLLNNPEDLLQSSETVNIWDRFIGGIDDLHSEKTRQRRLVLQHISLFKRFGFESAVISEAKAIAKFVEEADRQITWARFQEIIQELRQRKILQGEYTLYLTPKLLHIKLWVDWWDTYGRAFDFQVFTTNFSPEMLEGFYEMFEYAASSQAAPRIVKELLGSNGPFQRDNFLHTRLGSHFFLALTKADPQGAMQCLNQTVGTWDTDALKNFTEGRREVIYALQMIAIWDDLFADAARLLLRLGEAENETYANNASGVFAELFSPAWGDVATTEASPQNRLPVLEEAITSDSKAQRSLAFRACEAALETDHFSRTMGAEEQGLKRSPRLWMPQTWGEIFDAYQQVWQLLYRQLDRLSPDEQAQAAHLLIAYSPGVGSIHALAEMVLDTLNDLKNKTYVDQEKLMKSIIWMLRRQKQELPPEIIARWQQLKDELTGNDFASLLKRYVGMAILDDKFDDADNYIGEPRSQIEELARQAIAENNLLETELHWLIISESENTGSFGYELGIQDKAFSLLPLLVSAQRDSGAKANAFFLSGYLRALHQQYKESWEQVMEFFADNVPLNSLVLELIWRSGGISERMAKLVNRLLEDKVNKPTQLQVFNYGASIRNVPPPIFEHWIELLLTESTDHSIHTALELFDTYYFREGQGAFLPDELTFRLLTHSHFCETPQNRLRNQSEEWHWIGVANGLLRKYPQYGLALAEVMLENFGNHNAIFNNSHSSTQGVLDILARQQPHEVWQLITRYITPPGGSQAFRIMHWLPWEIFTAEAEKPQGESPKVSLDKLWQWIDEDVEHRAHYIARFVPKGWIKLGNGLNLAREILLRYGTRQDVRSSLIANFSSGNFIAGSFVAYLQRKKQEVFAYKEGETNRNVLRWIDEVLEGLEHQLEAAKIREERMF
jgi:hypothetical protein